MTLITRFDPIREMSSLQNALNRMFQNYDPAMASTELMTSGSFIPPVDIYEDEHNFTLRLEVPGVEEKDLDIRVENNTLSVKGERRFSKEEKEENFHRIERRYGTFVRSFTLPQTVDTDKVNASYDNGLLTLVLAKKAEAKPKQIKVSLGGKKEIKGSAA